MRKIIMFIYLLFLTYLIFPQSTFFSINDQIIIRNEPNNNSRQIGTLYLFDMAVILENTGNNWYKINYNNIEGYVFGGDGIILKEEYIINTIDDIGNILSTIFQIEELNRYLFTWRKYNKYFMVRLDYKITFMGHESYLGIYYRPEENINENEVSKKYNLQIINANNKFGRGDSYRILKNNNQRSTEIITKGGNVGRYFFSEWASETSYDIANFLFETKFDNIFNGIIIMPLNIWLDMNSPIIRKFDTNFIHEARVNRIKESILYHLYYEIVKRFKI